MGRRVPGRPFLAGNLQERTGSPKGTGGVRAFFWVLRNFLMCLASFWAKRCVELLGAFLVPLHEGKPEKYKEPPRHI